MALLRQYFPKGKTTCRCTRESLSEQSGSSAIIERPRETLQFETQQKDLTPVVRRPLSRQGKAENILLSTEFFSVLTQSDIRTSTIAVGWLRLFWSP